MNDTNVILEVKNLKKTFGDHVVLKDINTTITKGEVIAIIGPSGCGKSTFLHFLYLKVYHASALQRHGQKHAFVL